MDNEFGHRTVTHSLIGYAGLAVLMLPLYFFQANWYKAFLIGYFSHLVIDCLNKTGVPFLWPNNTYAVFPGNPKWRIQVGTLGEYILCGFIILLTIGIWYLNGIGIRSWFHSMLASPQMAVAEYRSHMNTHRMNVTVNGFYTLTQEPIQKKTFEIVDALDDSTLLVTGDKGYLITIGKSPSDSIQAKRAVIQKTASSKIHSDNFIFEGQSIKLMLPYLTEDTYVSGTVEAHTRPRYIKMDMRPFKNGEFESIKVSPGLSEFDAKLELRNASIDRLKQLSEVPISGELVSRRINTR